MHKHEIYMNMTKEYSYFSKCTFTKIGSMAVNEHGKVIATGVNGTIPGLENCCDHTFENREDHIKFTLENEIHSEENLILELATSSVKFSKLTIYVTSSPCSVCLKHLLGLTRRFEGNKVQIEKIIYNEKYHRTSHEELLAMKKKAKLVNCELLSLKEAMEH